MTHTLEDSAGQGVCDAAGPSGSRPLRYAVLFTRGRYALWHERCLDALLAVEGARPCLLIHGDKSGLPARPRYDRGGKLWRLLMRIENRFRPARAWQARPLPGEIAALPKMDCGLQRQGNWACRFAEADVAAIRAQELDFIVAFLGYDILRGDILEAARYGVWSYHMADPARYRGAPPGVWEIYESAPTTGVVLQRLTDRLDGGIVLRAGRCPTLGWSINRNTDNLYDQAAGFVAAACRDLVAGDRSRLEAPPLRTTAAIRRAPGNRQAIRLAALLLRNGLFRLLGRS